MGCYRQKLKSAKPVVKRWTYETERVLQACLDFTDWSVFEAAANDLDELTETVPSYISFCEDMCIPPRTHLTYINDKPWFTAKLRQLRHIPVHTIVNLYIVIPYLLVLFNSSFYYLCFLFCHCHSVAPRWLLSRKKIPRMCKLKSLILG